MVPSRTKLVDVHTTLTRPGGARWEGTPGGRLVPEAARALELLQQAIVAAGGTFLVNSLWRSHEEQKRLRAAYDSGHGAGAQRPGQSAHQGGRAVDVSTDDLAFGGVGKDQQLDRLWQLAKPLGWSPVLDRPDETKAERWHLDYWGDWLPVRARRGYAEAAEAAIVDLGDHGEGAKAWGTDEALARCLQAHLHRAGYDCGPIDGDAAGGTKRAAQAAKLSADVVQAAALAVDLPSSSKLLWARQ